MSKPEVIIIAALAESNRAIANNGELPWNIPEDSQRVESLMRNHTIVVGRKTWEKDLKNSPPEDTNIIVITSNPQEVQTEIRSLNYPGDVLVFNSVQAALEAAKDREKIFIAGGASIYSQALEIANIWELTLVEGDFTGDTFFPEYQHLIGNKFELVAKEEHPGFRFETYKKVA